MDLLRLFNWLSLVWVVSCAVGQLQLVDFVSLFPTVYEICGYICTLWVPVPLVGNVVDGSYPDRFANVNYSGIFQLIFDVQGELSTFTDQNACIHNWIDLQAIRATTWRSADSEWSKNANKCAEMSCDAIASVCLWRTVALFTIRIQRNWKYQGNHIIVLINCADEDMLQSFLIKI